MKIAIVGASYLQRPLVAKAKQLNIETHVFAWKEGNVVGDICDYYYPISIIDKEAILTECKRIGIDGIVSIASDLAMPAVNYVAARMGLTGNSEKATLFSTNKSLMKSALVNSGIVDAFYAEVNSLEGAKKLLPPFPCVVKPVDRSGSRGVSKVTSKTDFLTAVEKALALSLSKSVIVEEFIEGKEYSVEFISWEGEHHPLAITQKVTTGAPYFVEREHHQPANLSLPIQKKVYDIVNRTLKSVGIKFGASHTEVIIRADQSVYVVEVAGRMGGDFIGSHLVHLSTGFDYVKAVIDVACNRFQYDSCITSYNKAFAGVYYLFGQSGFLKEIQKKEIGRPDIVEAGLLSKPGDIIYEIDSSDKRLAYVIYKGERPEPIDNLNDIFKLTIT
jgi:biotin carboxylase